MVMRYVFGVALGIVTTFALFLLMQALIKSDKSPFDEGVKGKIVGLRPSAGRCRDSDQAA